jgi:hypothetical protein
MDTTRTLKLCAAAAFAALLLSACGGGSDGGTDASASTADQVPADASTSTAAMARWMTRLAVAAPGAEEPLDTTRFNPPAPDDSEPETVN